jgi:hypothetical protein
VKALLLPLAALCWGACVLMLPHLTLDMAALSALMFVAEVLGLAVSFGAAVLLAIGDTVEAFFAERA